ncbi:unnamed protein product [Adineta steineri]|uniref:Uncharacterized protein n=2 Tax=Adineta steineri TaxID=433720 RepID=A0A814QCV0_9BILA|nr:unnamed protein product [Adineta steineri]
MITLSNAQRNSFQHLLSNENDYSIDFPNVTIQHVCENELLTIKCLNINETIQIIRSMYGRTSQRICNNDLIYRFFDKTCANIEQSKYQTKLRCHGKSTCDILISNHIFTDPCGLNIPKHFEVHYRCIDKERICSKLFSNCSKSKDLKCIEKIQEDFSCQCPSNICQYVDNQVIGFTENVCLEEYLQGFHWTTTSINKNQSQLCPSPCNGEISRYCNSNSQWSKPDYINCKCPLKQSDQLSTHRSANSYVFQCNFWLINRILPKDNSCILSFTNWNEKKQEEKNSLNCLLSAFEQMTFQSCLGSNSFGIDFQNLIFEIFIPIKNESKFHLLSNNYDSLLINQLIVDRTNINKDESHANLPMMVIDTKNFDLENRSIILIEQEKNFNSMQTANVTVIFNRPSLKYYYQCRAYRLTNFSLQVDSTNLFFACQSLCSNSSHVICQCPFFNPFMHYRLHIDASKTDDDFNDECLEQINYSIDDNLNRIDQYLKDMSSIKLAKKFLLFVDKILDKEKSFLNWNILYRILKQIEYFSFKLLKLSNSFISINNHIEFFLKTKKFQYENSDRSISITVNSENIPNLDFQLIIFTISNINISGLLNSQIVNLNILPKQVLIDDVQIKFRHLNKSNQIPICVYLKNFEDNKVQWSTDGCQLLSTNLTHTICSCKYQSTYALFENTDKPIVKSNANQLLFITKIGCMVSIGCLLLTIILLIIMRSHTDMDDDLTTVRSIIHTNMLLCLIIVQILFLFGIDQTKSKFGCRIISILLDYFLLATISWMFVDGIELLIALKHVFKIDRIRLLAYSLYSYGFPLLIVFLSITLSAKNETDLNQYCWLSHDNAFIWAFAIPFILLILANLCFFLISMCSMCRKINLCSDRMNEIRFSLRDMSTISILFGLTWITGLFYFYGQTFLFAYIFTILNSLHGFLILIFYCLLQKHVQTSFGKFCFYKNHHISIFHCFVKSNQNQKHIRKKSFEHFSLPDNTSTSGYSSAHSSDLNNKQILCNQTKDYTNNLSQQIYFHNHYNRRSCLVHETPYLPSIPTNLLPNRLSTFRYQLPVNEIILSHEQNEQLLQKTQIHDDDHQYYEIG